MSQFQPPQQSFPSQQQWQQQQTYYPPQIPIQSPNSSPPQPPTRPPISQHSRPLWTSPVLWFIIGLIVGGSIAGGGVHQFSTTTNTNIQVTPQSATTTGLTTSVDQSTPQPQNTILNVGSSAHVGTWIVTLNSIKTSKGDDINSPKAGDIYLVIDVTSNNTASSPQLISSGASFILKDNTGQAYDETITDIGKPPDGTVQPGEKLRGQIVYEVPTSEHSFTFQFQDSTYNGNAATWAFTI